MMAEVITIARPYARALFQLARETHSLRIWSRVLEVLSAITKDPETIKASSDPCIGRAHLRLVFIEILHQFLSSENMSMVGPDVERLITVLLDYQRLLILPMVATLFEQYRKKAEGLIDARIESAFPLTNPQVETLNQALSKAMNSQIRSEVIVDSSLIGGVRITMGDLVIDASIRAKLSSLGTHLKS